MDKEEIRKNLPDEVKYFLFNNLPLKKIQNKLIERLENKDYVYIFTLEHFTNKDKFNIDFEKEKLTFDDGKKLVSIPFPEITFKNPLYPSFKISPFYLEIQQSLQQFKKEREVEYTLLFPYHSFISKN